MQTFEFKLTSTLAKVYNTTSDQLLSQRYMLHKQKYVRPNLTTNSASEVRYVKSEETLVEYFQSSSQKFVPLSLFMNRNSNVWWYIPHCLSKNLLILQRSLEIY